jgi:hypothetical protein
MRFSITGRFSRPTQQRARRAIGLAAAAALVAVLVPAPAHADDGGNAPDENERNGFLTAPAGG